MSDILYKEAVEAIMDQDKDKAVEVAKKAIDSGVDPLKVLNHGFIVGITQVGDCFSRGTMFLPELVLSAEAMLAATELIMAKLPEGANQTNWSILAATVQGDVHDLGKGIAVAMFRANGFTVHDIGRDIPVDTIIDYAEKNNIDVIATSALLTTTMVEQKKLEEALRAAKVRDKYKTLVAGGPVTPRWAKRIGADIYAEDANDGVVQLRSVLEKNAA